MSSFDKTILRFFLTRTDRSFESLLGGNMTSDEIVQKDSWICPGCLSQNSTSALDCSCGITISENDMRDFRADMTPIQLFEEASSCAFMGADEKAFLLRYYLQMRFPDSSEAKKAKDKVDIDDNTDRVKYLELLNKRSRQFSEAQEVICGRSGNNLIQTGEVRSYYNVSRTRILKYVTEIYHKGELPPV
jgi:hypothetical protein